MERLWKSSFLVILYFLISLAYLEMCFHLGYFWQFGVQKRIKARVCMYCGYETREMFSLFRHMVRYLYSHMMNEFCWYSPCWMKIISLWRGVTDSPLRSGERCIVFLGIFAIKRVNQLFCCRRLRYHCRCMPEGQNKQVSTYATYLNSSYRFNIPTLTSAPKMFNQTL